MIFHPTASGKSRTVTLTVEASCRCGWYLQAPDVHPADRVAATRRLEFAAHRHELDTARRPYAHDASVTAAAA